MTYAELLEKIEIYKNKYNVCEIGQTKQKRKIFAVEIINNVNFFTAIFVASVHAREFISSDLICKFLDDGIFADIENFNISFVIMLNPDGVELCLNGLNSIENELDKQKLLEINNQSYDFSFWKANVSGVDLNNNFDADFGKFQTKTSASSSGFAGEYCECENETIAIKNYILSKNTFFVVSYHSKGEEIYFNYFQDEDRLLRDKLIAERFSKSTGYLIKNVENVSSGGLKDWCVKKLKIPSLTIELGSDELSHPIGENFLPEIFEKNKNVAKDLEFAYNIFNIFNC